MVAVNLGANSFKFLLIKKVKFVEIFFKYVSDVVCIRRSRAIISIIGDLRSLWWCKELRGGKEQGNLFTDIRFQVHTFEFDSIDALEWPHSSINRAIGVR